MLEFSGRGEADTDQRFPAFDIGGQQIIAARARAFSRGECGRREHRTAVNNRGRMRVVVFEAVNHAAVGERGGRRRKPVTGAEMLAGPPLPFSAGAAAR